jgi:hypothetical protein
LYNHIPCIETIYYLFGKLWKQWKTNLLPILRSGLPQFSSAAEGDCGPEPSNESPEVVSEGSALAE